MRQILGKVLNREKPSRVVLITSKKLVTKLSWAVKEIKSLTKFSTILVPDGEEAKDWAVLQKVLLGFIKENLDRKSLIIALGGGTVTDLAGFAAGVYQRGIKYVNIPTTLLGMVDSSIGGKTAINLGGFKNQIGVFHLPCEIIVDNRLLKTLLREQFIDGLGEIVKCGFIKDASIIKIIEENNFTGLQKPKVVEKLIKKSQDVKNFFVKKDLNDRGARQILNFGHTLGHAIEMDNKISHGRAVLLGMKEELKMTEELGITTKGVRERLERILDKLGIEDQRGKINYKHIAHDKKVIGKKISLPVIERVGQCQIAQMDIEKINSIVRQMWGRKGG